MSFWLLGGHVWVPGPRRLGCGCAALLVRLPEPSSSHPRLMPWQVSARATLYAGFAERCTFKGIFDKSDVVAISCVFAGTNDASSK